MEIFPLQFFPLYCIVCAVCVVVSHTVINKQTTKHSYTNTLLPTVSRLVPRFSQHTILNILCHLTIDSRSTMVVHTAHAMHLLHQGFDYIALTNPSCLCTRKKQRCLQLFESVISLLWNDKEKTAALAECSVLFIELVSLSCVCPYVMISTSFVTQSRPACAC